MTRVDILLAQIERTLAECDAKRLPPLTSDSAAAVLELVNQAGLKVNLWQEGVIRATYAYPGTACRPPIGPPARSSGSATSRGRHPDIVIIDDPIDTMLDARRPWWRRWWSR